MGRLQPPKTPGNSVYGRLGEPHMVNNLRSFSTANEMWEYLGRIYNQDNNAHRFQLELEIANFTQGNLSIE